MSLLDLWIQACTEKLFIFHDHIGFHQGLWVLHTSPTFVETAGEQKQKPQTSYPPKPLGLQYVDACSWTFLAVSLK